MSKPKKAATKKAPKPGVATAENVQPQTVETLTAATLKKAIMTIAIDELKNAQAPWHELLEAEQEKVINRLDGYAVDLTTRALELFATSGVARVACTLDAVTIKDGIKAMISLSRHDAQRHDLIDAQGTTVWVVLANPEQFADAPHGIKPDADQKALDLNRALGAIADSEAAEAKPTMPPGPKPDKIGGAAPPAEGPKLGKFGVPDPSKPVADPDAPADPDVDPNKPNP